MIRWPLLITTCLPWRTIRNPALFKCAHSVKMVDARDLRHG
jgi:hypothetical protein